MSISGGVEMKQFIIIDCHQHDFISMGAWRVKPRKWAVDNIVKLVKWTPGYGSHVLPGLAWPTNKSFKVNGGIWPVHHVQNELGSELDPRFDHLNERRALSGQQVLQGWGQWARSNASALFAQGRIRASCWMRSWNFHVMVAGIASEFCVLESNHRELVASGKKVDRSEGWPRLYWFRAFQSLEWICQSGGHLLGVGEMVRYFIIFVIRGRWMYALMAVDFGKLKKKGIILPYVRTCDQKIVQIMKQVGLGELNLDSMIQNNGETCPVVKELECCCLLEHSVSTWKLLSVMRSLLA